MAINSKCFRYHDKGPDGEPMITSMLLSGNVDYRIYNRPMPSGDHVVVMEIPRRTVTEFVELFTGSAASCQNVIHQILTCEYVVNLARDKIYVGNNIVDAPQEGC